MDEIIHKIAKFWVMLFKTNPAAAILLAYIVWHLLLRGIFTSQSSGSDAAVKKPPPDKPIQHEETEYECERCGDTVKADDKVCPKCGDNLEEEVIKSDRI